MVIVFFFFFVLKQQFFPHYCLWMWARANERKSYSPWSLVQSQGWYRSQHWTTVRNSLRDLKIPFAYLGHFPDPFPHSPPGSWLQNNLRSVTNTRLIALWGQAFITHYSFPMPSTGGGAGSRDEHWGQESRCEWKDELGIFREGWKRIQRLMLMLDSEEINTCERPSVYKWWARHLKFHLIRMPLKSYHSYCISGLPLPAQVAARNWVVFIRSLEKK